MGTPAPSPFPLRSALAVLVAPGVAECYVVLISFPHTAGRPCEERVRERPKPPPPRMPALTAHRHGLCSSSPPVSSSRMTNSFVSIFDLTIQAHLEGLPYTSRIQNIGCS